MDIKEIVKKIDQHNLCCVHMEFKENQIHLVMRKRLNCTNSLQLKNEHMFNFASILNCNVDSFEIHFNKMLEQIDEFKRESK